MRAMLAAVVVMLSACGPAVAPKPPSFDEDFSNDRAASEEAASPKPAESPAPSAAATTSAEPSACPPKTKNCTTRRPTATASVVAMPPLRNAAPPPGKGLRTGTIDRAHLVAVLDGGPGAFLRQLEVSARLDGDRFIGWQLVQLLDHESPLADLDLAPGDVLLAINGKPVGKPDQLHAVWESLRTANQIVADLSRGDAKVQLVFDVEPKI